VEGRELALTRLGKALWPEEGYTKADLVAYFQKIAPWLLPHLRGRPLTLTRYPDGIRGPSFYQKNLPAYAPGWIRTHLHRTRRGQTVRFILAEDLPTLVWLANQAAIELHTWLSTIEHPDRPDQAVVDLDPAPPAGFEEAREAALLVRRLLDHLGLRGYPKLSGATGIHIHLPLAPRYSHRQVVQAVQALGRLLQRTVPHLVTLERAVARRAGKVYFDYLQNTPGKTMIAPYSPRALPGAPVATPVTWEEVETAHPRDFTLETIPARLRRWEEKAKKDPFSGLLAEGQELPPVMEKLGLELGASSPSR